MAASSHRGQAGDAQAPQGIGDLGWWYYLARSYPKAVALLSDAVQQRPGNSNLCLKLAWTQIETGRYGDALHTLETVMYTQETQPAREMARAVAQWRAQQPDAALADFGIAMDGQPEWSNPRWVTPLYSALVTQNIKDMQAERDRRKQRLKLAQMDR